MYVYPDATADPALAERVAIQQAMLDVAYPAEETLVCHLTEARWATVRAQLTADGDEITVVDTREAAP